MAHATKTTAEFEAAYRQLNPGQKQAVDTIEGPVMVLAGPGTGKTQTLTVRIGHILQQTQLDPWNILCLTFTESAAAEMRERLASLIGTPAYHVQISTFHAFCNSVLQDHPEIFALASDWQPLSDVERVKLIQDTLDSLSGTSPLKPFGAPYLYLKDVVQHIQALKQEDISPKKFGQILKAIEAFTKNVKPPFDAFVNKKAQVRTDADCDQMVIMLKQQATKTDMPDVLMQQLDEIATTFQQMRAQADGKREAGKARTKCKNDLKRMVGKLETNLPRWQELAKVYQRYEKALHEQGRYDFEDMIIRVVQEFKTNKDLLADYQEQFQYVLVDEFQDTNGAQNEVVELLGSAQEQPNIFVVGDDKQSIYRFQGASLANMLAFYDRYQKHVRVISLSENYRSQNMVLKAASATISHSQHSLADVIPNVKSDLTAKVKLKPVKLQQFVAESPQHEVAIMAREIKALLNGGAAPAEVAVLVRYNRDAVALAAALRQFGVKVSLAAGENALESPDVKAWLAMWRYILEPFHNDHLLATIIHFDWWEIDPLDALKAIHGAGARRMRLTKFCADMAALKSAGVKTPAAIVDVLQKLARWKKHTATDSLSNALTTMLDESGWLAHAQKDAEGLVALEHMSTVLEQAKSISSGGTPGTLSEFMALLDLHVAHDVPLTTPERRLGKDAITVMTAHKSKGKEFEYVIIPRFVDGAWGGGRASGRLQLPQGLVRGDQVADGEAEEDERRLFYVSLTRAKKQVILTRSHVNEAERAQTPSQFLHELPAKVVATQEEQETERDTTIRLVEAELVAPVPAVRDLRSWVTRLLDGYVLSASHLNDYLEDPQKFYVNRLLRVPAPEQKTTALGNAVHGSLRDFLALYREGVVLPDKEELLNLFERHLRRSTLDAQALADTAEAGKSHLAGYYDQYRDQFSRETIGEYDFAAHHVRIGDVPITGKIDKLELLGNKQVAVVDYKTAAPENKTQRLKPGPKGDYFRQMVFYKLLCDASPQFPYQMVRGEIDFLRPDKQGKFVKREVKVTDKETVELTETIQRVWQEIHELKFLESTQLPEKREVVH